MTLLKLALSGRLSPSLVLVWQDQRGRKLNEWLSTQILSKQFWTNLVLWFFIWVIACQNGSLSWIEKQPWVYDHLSTLLAIIFGLTLGWATFLALLSFAIHGRLESRFLRDYRELGKYLGVNLEHLTIEEARTLVEEKLKKFARLYHHIPDDSSSEQVKEVARAELVRAYDAGTAFGLSHMPLDYYLGRQFVSDDRARQASAAA